MKAPDTGGLMAMYFFILSFFIGHKSYAQFQLSSSGTYTQNFNSLPANGVGMWTDNSAIQNWFAQRKINGNTIAASIGSDNAGNLYSYGVNMNADRALGSIGSSSTGDFAYGLLLKNTSGKVITEITIAYTLEQWRNSGSGTQQKISFFTKETFDVPNSNMFSVLDQFWTEVPSLQSGSLQSIGAAGALDGNLPANRSNIISAIPNLRLEPNEYLFLKWEDPDHSGNDHGLAIDDVSISWIIPTTDISVNAISQTNFIFSDCITPSKAFIDFVNSGIVQAGNIYTVEMSDADGSFNFPITVASVNSSLNALTGLTITIPASITSGNNYRLRIRSSNPLVIGTICHLPISVNQSAYCITQPTDYFRTRSSGNWNNANIWESSPNESFNPILIATMSPSNKSNKILIRNAHTVNINSDLRADQITITSGGTLIYSANNFILYDGLGDDINIENEGIFTLAKASAAPAYTDPNARIKVCTGGILRVASSGLTNAGSGVNADNIIYQHQSVLEYAAGLPFSSVGVTYFPNADSATAPLFRITSTIALPVGGNNPTIINGFFEVSSGCNVTWSGSAEKIFRNGFGGNGTHSLINGSIRITGTNPSITNIKGSGNVQLSGGNGVYIAEGAKVSLLSNYIVNGQGFNFVVSKGGFLNCYDNILFGSSNVVLSPGGRLGIGAAEGISLSAPKGNIQTAGRIFSSEGHYEYNGNLNQVSGDGLPDIIDTLTLNNTGLFNNNTISLTKKTTINSAMHLKKGIFVTEISKELLFNSESFYTGASFDAFVEGPVQKKGKSDFIFPVGARQKSFTISSGTSYAGGYRPIGISNISGSDTFKAWYHLSNPYLLGPISGMAKQSGLKDISRCEYWDLTRDGAAHADVTLSWSENPIGKSLCNIPSGNTALSKLQVVPFFNNSWGDDTPPYFGQTAITPHPDINDLSLIRWDGGKLAGDIGSYAKFAIGTNSIAEAPLLFQLNEFNLNNDIRGVNISFQVNQNNLIKDFAIERSNDGLQFKIIHTFLSKKNEKTANYSFQDTDVQHGWLYYRIRITDFAGNIQYSDIRKIRTDNNIKKIETFLQSANNQIRIHLASDDKINEICIMSSTGQILFKKSRPNNITQINISSFRPGIYYIRMAGTFNTFTKPFLKN